MNGSSGLVFRGEQRAVAVELRKRIVREDQVRLEPLQFPQEGFAGFHPSNGYRGSGLGQLPGDQLAVRDAVLKMQDPDRLFMTFHHLPQKPERPMSDTIQAWSGLKGDSRRATMPGKDCGKAK
jgi:hypothetical protein